MEISNLDWPEDLETGIKLLDEQHQHYFKLVNQYLENLSAAPSKPEDISGSAKKLEFLLQYAKEHFSTEELIMKRMQYPDQESHCDQHKFFLQQMTDLQKRTRFQSFQSSLVREVNFYMVEWFMEHIRLSDMELVDFLNEKSAEDKGCLRFLDYLPTSLTGPK